MTSGLTPQMKASIAFAWIGGSAFLLVAIYLTIRRRRASPAAARLHRCYLDLVDRGSLRLGHVRSVRTRHPSHAVVVAIGHDMGWLPASVPVGYISYFATPAVAGAALGRWLSSKFQWRLPTTLLSVGLFVGFVWAVLFNGFLGARTGIFYYGRVIPGLALRQGTKHQYPLYDALAMGVMVMVFAYILGRTDPDGRTVIERWAESKSPSRLLSTVLSVFGVIVIANLFYGAVFAPHLTAKLEGWETAGPTANLFQGVPNQPLYGTAHGR